jgi:hypothetical protein
MSVEAIKAIQMVYANTTEHDWPVWPLDQGQRLHGHNEKEKTNEYWSNETGA